MSDNTAAPPPPLHWKNVISTIAEAKMSVRRIGFHARDVETLCVADALDQVEAIVRQHVGGRPNS